MSDLRKNWKAEVEKNNFRYFVLKTKEVLEILSDNELEWFNYFLAKIEKQREKDGKPAFRDYWIAGRHWKCGPEVKETIERIEGIKLKERNE